MSMVYNECESCKKVVPDEKTIILVKRKVFGGMSAMVLCENCAQQLNSGVSS